MGIIERNIGNLHDQDTGLLVGYRNPVTGKQEDLNAPALQALVSAPWNPLAMAPSGWGSRSTPWVVSDGSEASGSWTDLSTDGTGSVAAQQPEYAKLGASGVKMIWSAGGAFCRIGRTLAANVAVPEGSIGVFIKWKGDQGFGWQLYVSNDTGLSNIGTASISSTVAIPNGWTLLLFSQADFTPSGTFSWAAGIRRWRLASLTSSASYPEAGFGGLVLGVKSSPMIYLSCDDGRESLRNVALPITRKYGYKATMYINQAVAGGAGYLTVEQLQQMQNTHGWPMANHGAQHLNYSTLTAAQMLADYQTNYAWLSSIGANAPGHFAYPFGVAAAGVGGAIPGDVLQAAGAQSGRLASTRFLRGAQSYPGIGVPDIMRIRALQLGRGTVVNTVAVVKANIDAAISRGEHICLYFHNILDQQNPEGTGGQPPADGNDYYKDDFDAVLSYCKEKEVAGLASVVGDVRNFLRVTQGLTA